MAASHQLLSLCILLLCSIFFFLAHGSTEHGFVNYVPTNSNSFPSKPVACPSVSRVTTSDPIRASVPLVHRYGPCSSSSPANTNKPSFAERLRRDRARRDHIISRASRRSTATTLYDTAGVRIPTAMGNAVDSLEYVVTLGIGTPPVQQTVLIDTGSDLSWVQCKPCNSSECYPQKDPLFDPSSSSTYATVPCDSDACKQLVADSYDDGCTNNGSGSGGPSLCQYKIIYGGGEHTVGLYSTETLTLQPGVTVSNFRFGCALHQQGQFDRFDGLLGLGGAPESLVSQTAAQYGGAFSYCLPVETGTLGFLALGAPSNNNNNTAGFVFAPVHQFPGVSTFYAVTLAGISVAGKQLDVPPTVFSRGMFIDSGTVVTSLPATAYSALRSAFRTAMSAYRLVPPKDGLDTCYDFTGHSNVTVPKIALTFAGGATIDLDVPSGVMLEDCLAFVGGSSDNIIGIIGNVNQRTFEVLYDMSHGKVGFRPGAC